MTAMVLCVFTACERQVSELHVLQVHLHLWRNERTEHGRGSAVVYVVLCLVSPPSPHTTVQGPLRIRTSHFHSNYYTLPWHCLLYIEFFYLIT